MPWSLLVVVGMNDERLLLLMMVSALWSIIRIALQLRGIHLNLQHLYSLRHLCNRRSHRKIYERNSYSYCRIFEFLPPNDFLDRLSGDSFDPTNSFGPISLFGRAPISFCSVLDSSVCCPLLSQSRAPPSILHPPSSIHSLFLHIAAAADDRRLFLHYSYSLQFITKQPIPVGR